MKRSMRRPMSTPKTRGRTAAHFEPLEDRRGHPRPYFLEQCLPGLGRQQRPQFGQQLGRLHGASSLARKSLATGYTHSSLMEVRAPVLDLVPRPSERPTHRQLAAL